ncbi:MAG TPA: DUF1206 domain-containing protein [Caulobacteraceae bacterium]|nr:DUF1206 domain-containing protein [Caulobacteraceae bacterium]
MRRLLLRLNRTGLLTLVARAGYGARGFVYLNMGLIALLAALELRRSAVGLKGAMEEVGRWPLGLVWLSLVAWGLAGFVLWRLAQALLDADAQGRSPAGLAMRAGQGLSAFVYAVLSLSAFELADGIEDRLEGEEREAEMAAAALLSQPWGQELLLAAGLFVAACGVANMVKGGFNDFSRQLDCSHEVRRWAVPLARVGYLSRGVVFVPLGLFLAEAALDLDSKDAGTIGAALGSLQDQPFGAALLGAASLGLIAFGLFGFVQARWRRVGVGPPRPGGRPLGEAAAPAA